MSKYRIEIGDLVSGAYNAVHSFGREKVMVVGGNVTDVFLLDGALENIGVSHYFIDKSRDILERKNGDYVINLDLIELVR